MRAVLARRRIARHIRRAARRQGPGLDSARGKPRGAGRARARGRHIDATRRVAELASYERLFSLWHVLHLPLFFMLLVAGIVHVIAVHVY